MIIDKLLKDIDPISITGDSKAEVNSLELDSRAVEQGAMFFAVDGLQTDGHKYIESAIGRGAVAVVCERKPELIDKDVCYIVVEDSTKALADIATAFYGNPSSKLKLIGITGTNGKTTTATLLYDLFRGLGYKVGLISTVVNRINERSTESSYTTPDAIALNRLLEEMVEAGCDYCFMEVSSHSIAQERIRGLKFAGGVFTNITHEHLDYHKTFDEYIKVKKRFFDQLPTESFALVNIDDRNGRVMVQNTKAEVKTLSLKSFSDFKCRVMEMHLDGMLLDIDDHQVWVRFLGGFNAYNLLSVYAVGVMLGVEPSEVLTQMSLLSPVSGRFEFLRSAHGVTAIVDYAHTFDALENVLDTIDEIRGAGQKLYVVVGCGGNRDREKRPTMAHLAASRGDLAILTSDNPRNEDPEMIIEEMKRGIKPSDHYIAITDRRQAIKTAAIMANKGDIILLAGKGHEKYQIIGDKKLHFDDHQEIAEAFANLAK